MLTNCKGDHVAMADFCYFCKKKIGFFDTSSRTAFAQTVCGNCVNKVNRVAILYNREFSEYTLYSLEDAGKILEKAPSFEMYISRYLKIRAEYEPQIQHYQELAEKEKKTLKEIEKGMDDDRREYEAELKECEKEWKAERASSDYKNELKEYEKARRRGDEVAARTLKRLMDAVDDNYRAEVEKKQNSYNRFQREPLELCEEWKSIVKCYEAIVNRLRNYQAVKEYVFRVTEVPSEKLVLGHEIERRSEEKSEGREYILLYLKKILKVDESRLQEAANNDVILAEFGKSWINSGVEKLLIKERLNEGSIERLQHAIESHKILLSTVSDPDILRRAEDAMDESEKTLDECMKTRGDLDKEFNRKDLELKAAFNRLTEPDTRKLASENNTNSANIVKATTTKQSNNSQTVTIAQPAAVKPSEKQEKGVTSTDSRQEILVEATGSNAMLTLWTYRDGQWVEDMSTTAAIGSDGLTTNKTEGDHMTPEGTFPIYFAFSTKAKNTKIAFETISEDSVWVCDPESVYYNTLQSKNNPDKDWTDKGGAENMYPKFSKGSSNACICFGFNGDGWSPYGAVAYGGSALFIDGVGENGKMNSGYGDIKISGKDMTKLLSYLDSDYNPTITIRAAQ